MKMLGLTTVVLVLSSLCISTLSAQDKQVAEKIAQQQRAQAEKLKQDRAERVNRDIRERVKQMATQAAALRSEFNFEEAAKVEAEIRNLCWNYDPRVIRANDLKRRAAEARISGKISDADMFEREADRVLQDLKLEYAGDKQTLLAATGDIQSPDNSRLLDEVVTLRAQVVKLTNEIYRLKGQLSDREQQLSQSLKKR